MELLNPLVEYPSYNVAYTGTAGVTTAWNPGPEGVVVWSTTAAYVRVGEGVTATTSDTPIPANTPMVMTGGTASRARRRNTSIHRPAAGRT